MLVDQWIRVFTAVTAFLQVVIWPLVILIIAIYLRGPVKKFLGGINEVNLKAGPVETTFKSIQTEIAASLGAASVTQQEHENIREGTPEGIASLVNRTVNEHTVRSLEGISILWVDDVPSNNTYARHALEALGVKFTLCASTDEAVKLLHLNPFSAIISDMGRPPDSRAGYTLLAKVQALNINVPFIIYASGGNKPEHQEEARQRGAYESASGPADLYKVVVALFTGKEQPSPAQPSQV